MSSFDCLMAVKFVRVSGPVRWGDHLNEITLICICPEIWVGTDGLQREWQ